MDDTEYRMKTPVKSAAESEGSPTSFHTPPSHRSQKVVDLTEDEAEEEIPELVLKAQVQPPAQDDDDIIEYAARSRRSLRERKPNTSLKASENVFDSLSRPRAKKANGISDLVGADIGGPNMTPVVSKRVAIRQEIASQTAAYRNRFFVEKKEFWLPLLPPHNYVKKLAEQHARMSPAELAKLPTITPYQEIEQQPRGITASMKPYQLSGLSFMVYLHRNVRTSLVK